MNEKKKKSPLKDVSLRKKSPDQAPYPLLFTHSYTPVHSTPSSGTLPDSEHARAGTIDRDSVKDIIRQLNEQNL